MLDQQDGHLACQAADQCDEIDNLAVGEALCRLVQDQQARALAQPHCDFKKPLVTIAEITRQLVGAVGDTDPLQRLGHPTPRFGLVPAGAPAHGQRYIFGHWQAAVNRGDLEGVGHAGADPAMRRFRGDVAAVKDHLATACRDAPGQHADKGCLAGPVRPDQRAHLACGKVEIHALDSLQAAEMPAEIFCREKAHGSHLSVRRRSSPTRPCGANRVSATRTRPAISM